MEDDDHQIQEDSETNLNSTVDLCQQLMDRYKASSAKQHQHLLATAIALRSIISSESLPLTPTAYFAATISALSRSIQDSSLDVDAVGALTSLLSLALPLVPVRGIESGKAVEAVEILVELLERGGLVSASSVRAVVKCLGVLLVGFCDDKDWNSLRLGLETLLKFSVDKRPKVRKCAQAFVEKIFTSFEDLITKKEASKFVVSLFEIYLPSIVELSHLSSSNGSTFEAPSKPELVEALHFLNALKFAVPILSDKTGSKILKKLLKLMHPEFTALTRHILMVTDAYFTASQYEAISPALESILVSFCAYLSNGKNKPVDTEEDVLKLLRRALDRVNSNDYRLCVQWLPTVIGSIIGIIMSSASSSLIASSILKEMITEFMEQPNTRLKETKELNDDNVQDHPSILGLCRPFEDALKKCEGNVNDDILAVVSVLFLRLGIHSYTSMKGILLKLADLLIHCNETDTSHLQHCIGASVIAMGPEKVLSILPIALNDADFTCSNTWLIPILGKYVAGASLNFYMTHILSLADLLQQASRKGEFDDTEFAVWYASLIPVTVKNIVIRKDLKGHARSLRALLPAFCRHPRDAYQNCGPLCKLLITFIKKDSHMHRIVAVAVKELLNQNTTSNNGSDATCCFDIKDFRYDLGNSTTLSQNAASLDTDEWTSSMTDVLEALTELFLKSTTETRLYFQSAIECLVPVVGYSTTKRIFLSSLEKFQSTEDTIDQEKKTVNRCSLLELASSFCKGADKDLLDIIFDFIRHALQGNDDTEHCAAFSTLSKILKEQVKYCYTRVNEVMDLLYPMKSDIERSLLEARFQALHALLVLIIEENLAEEEEKPFLILNEIILKLKDTDEEVRKVAHNTLLAISSSLHDPSCISDTYKNFVTMVTGYLCGSAPQPQSGAISALSVLVYKDPQLCLMLPDVVPSVLSLLKSKSVIVIKAVLGFVKVLVSCLQAKDLQTLLTNIVGILSWSAVVRNHFREKVIVIMEILIRKCGFAAIESVTPKKYEGFIKTVRENLHGKVETTETESTDNLKEAPMENPRGFRKRKTFDFGSVNESNKRNSVDKRFRISKDTPKPTGTKLTHRKQNRSQQYGRGKEHNSKGSRGNFAMGQKAQRFGGHRQRNH